MRKIVNVKDVVDAVFYLGKRVKQPERYCTWTVVLTLAVDSCEG